MSQTLRFAFLANIQSSMNFNELLSEWNFSFFHSPLLHKRFSIFLLTWHFPCSDAHSQIGCSQSRQVLLLKYSFCNYFPVSYCVSFQGERQKNWIERNSSEKQFSSPSENWTTYSMIFQDWKFPISHFHSPRNLLNWWWMTWTFSVYNFKSFIRHKSYVENLSMQNVFTNHWKWCRDKECGWKMANNCFR